MCFIQWLGTKERVKASAWDTWTCRVGGDPCMVHGVGRAGTTGMLGDAGVSRRWGAQGTQGGGTGCTGTRAPLDLFVQKSM